MGPRAIARSAIGPLVVGLAGWCALGEISVLTPDDPSIRLALPAPWYGFLASALAAALVPGWRQRPLTATPALLATLPWWPLALPAVALAWTGPMAWLAILLAAVAAFVPVGPERDSPITTGRPYRSAIAAAAISLVFAGFASWSLASRLPGGDEPHYLIITQSLLRDGDLRIENNHVARDFAAYYAGEVRPDFKVRGRNGAIYSIHAPGTSLVVLPAFAAFGYRGAQVTIVLLAAAASGLMWYAAWLATADRRAAWVAWLAVAATPTFVMQSITVFPDGVGLLITAATIVVLLRVGGTGTPGSSLGLVGASSLLAMLPWLHTRFSVLAAGLGALITWMLLTEPQRTTRERRRRLLVFSLVPAVSAVVWFAFFQLVYGTPNPVFPYGEDRGTSLAFVPGGLLGLFLDEQFGMLAYSPALAAGVVGLLLNGSIGSRSVRRVARGTACVSVAYLAATASYWMWWAGVPASPARFAAAVLPVFVVPVALAWRSATRAVRAVYVTLLTVSVASTAVVIGGGDARLAWNTRGVRAAWLDWLSGLSDLSRGWPSFFWRLSPDDLRTELHFFGHAFLWAAILAGSCALMVRIARTRTDSSHGVVAAWWLALSLMVAIQAGWWFNGVTGLSAASSQTAVLNAAASRQRVLQVRPYSIGPLRNLTGQLRIRATRADDVGDPAASWQPLLEVPPGDYELSIFLRRPRPGALALRIGRSAQPIRRISVRGMSEQTETIALPAGAGALFFEPDAALAAAADRIELTPLRLDAPVAGYASISTVLGAAELYFVRPTIYLEPDGFWARGGLTTEFTVAVPRGRPGVHLEISNGERSNEVNVDWGTGRERLNLAPAESRTVMVNVSREGAAYVRLTSVSGFRPSDDGTSEDRRYLGVRVRVVD